MNDPAPPLISIVIPAHKAEKYIVESLESIFQQTCPRWEIILWEDGVFDNTSDIVKQLRTPNGQPLRLFKHESNRGVSFTRNIAMEKAEGEYIAFMDADDSWTADHLESSLQTLRRENADVCFCGVNFIDEHGEITTNGVLPEPDAFENLADNLYGYNFVQCTSTLTFRRDIFQSGLKFDETLTHGEDLDLWLQFIANGYKVVHTWKVTCNYRKHGDSAMARIPRSVEQMVLFYEKNYNNPVVSLSVRKRYLALYLYVHGRLNWRLNPEKAMISFCKLLKLNPVNPKYIFWTFLTFLYSTCFHRKPQSPSV